MQLSDLTTEINRLDDEAALRALNEVVKQRLRALNAQRATVNKALLKAGTLVSLHGLSPAYVNGTRAVVVGPARGNRLRVEFTVPVPWRVQQRFGSFVDVPADALHPIEGEEEPAWHHEDHAQLGTARRPPGARRRPRT